MAVETGAKKAGEERALEGETVKAIFTGLVLFVLGVALATGQQSKKPQQPSAGRFSMVAAGVNEGFDGGATIKTATVFVIDSETGRVWRYMPDTTVKLKTGETLIREHFDAIPFAKYKESDKEQTDRPE